MVSMGSVGKSIKCPKCERRLHVPKDAIARRRKQLTNKEVKASPKPQPKPDSHSLKLGTRLSSLVDIPEPEAPPVHELGLGDPAKPVTEPADEITDAGEHPERDNKRRKKKRKKQKFER